jgi:hypothetical protein
MDISQPRFDLFHGLFEWHPTATGRGRLQRPATTPPSVPDPQTGRLLKVASLEVSDRAVCPRCTELGGGGYVSFVSDMRLAFACPSCLKLIWVAGA